MIRPALRAAGALLLLSTLPALAAQPVASAFAVPAADSGASGASSTRARRIPEKCVLPGYPPGVVAEDSALSLAMQLTVNPDGTIGKLELVRGSGVPAYDQAVLAAAAGCIYIPALHDGKPVAVSEVWEIVRVPGTAHP